MLRHTCAAAVEGLRSAHDHPERASLGLTAALRMATLEREMWASYAGPPSQEGLDAIRHRRVQEELQALAPRVGGHVDRRRKVLELQLLELGPRVEETECQQAAALARRAELAAEYEALEPLVSVAQLRRAYGERSDRLSAASPEKTGVGEECSTWVSVANGGLPSLGAR